MANILLIDDEQSICDLFGAALKKNGHNIMQCNNGEKALTLYQNHSFDLVITDMVMAKTDGQDIIKMIIASSNKTAILAISATDEYLKKAKNLGVDVILKKPFGPKKLQQIIDAMLSTPNN